MKVEVAILGSPSLERERERDRDTERDRDRDTDRQRQRQTDRQTDRQRHSPYGFCGRTAALNFLKIILYEFLFGVSFFLSFVCFCSIFQHSALLVLLVIYLLTNLFILHTTPLLRLLFLLLLYNS